MSLSNPQSYLEDFEYQESIVEKVDTEEDGNYMIELQNGTTLVVTATDDVQPFKGSVIRGYPNLDLGTRLRGVFVDGTKVFYRTPDEDKKLMEEEAKAMQDAQKADWESKKEKLDEIKAKLPDEFQVRIRGFWERNPDFHKFEEYEVFCCTEGAKVAKYFEDNHDGFDKPSEAVVSWWKDLVGNDEIKSEDLRKAKQDIAEETLKEIGFESGHSGNTQGMSVKLAVVYLRDKEDNTDNLRKIHGSLAMLVGSEEYGCWATSEEAKIEREKKEEENGS